MPVIHFIHQKADDSIFYLNGLVSSVKGHPPKERDLPQSPPFSEVLNVLLPSTMQVAAILWVRPGTFTCSTGATLARLHLLDSL